MMIPILINFCKTIAWLLENPKTRVRKTNGVNVVFGTVEKKKTQSAGPGREIFMIDYWTVVWEDEPHMFETFPAYKFQWIDGQYTLRT